MVSALGTSQRCTSCGNLWRNDSESSWRKVTLRICSPLFAFLRRVKNIDPKSSAPACLGLPPYASFGTSCLPLPVLQQCPIIQNQPLWLSVATLNERRKCILVGWLIGCRNCFNRKQS